MTFAAIAAHYFFWCWVHKQLSAPREVGVRSWCRSLGELDGVFLWREEPVARRRGEFCTSQCQPVNH